MRATPLNVTSMAWMPPTTISSNGTSRISSLCLERTRRSQRLIRSGQSKKQRIFSKMKTSVLRLICRYDTFIALEVFRQLINNSLSNCICLKRTRRKRSRGLQKLLLRRMQSNKPPRSQVEQLDGFHDACMTLTMMTLWFTGFIAGNLTLESLLLIYVIGPVALL